MRVGAALMAGDSFQLFNRHASWNLRAVQFSNVCSLYAKELLNSSAFRSTTTISRAFTSLAAPVGPASENCVVLEFRKHWLRESAFGRSRGRNLGRLHEGRCLVKCKSSKPLGPDYTARPSLDDVERLSRGLPSKSKIGSRRVPHRLTADERKAFDLARKRGYVVLKARTRIYPLVNSYRNFCDAVGHPNIRIEQGNSGLDDIVIVDLSTLRIEGPLLEALTAEISGRAVSMQQQDELQAVNPKSSIVQDFSDSDSDIEVYRDLQATDSAGTDADESGGAPEDGAEECHVEPRMLLSFKGDRPYTKRLAQDVLKICEEMRQKERLVL